MTDYSRPISELRRGTRFRLAHDPKRTGRLLDKGDSGAYVSLDRFVERTFQTKDGTDVTIRKTTDRITISNASRVLAYRNREGQGDG